MELRLGAGLLGLEMGLVEVNGALKDQWLVLLVLIVQIVLLGLIKLRILVMLMMEMLVVQT
ncbi:hypothetical protein DND62_31665 [Pseudomonas syringae pv. pisi]|nr:hypothetical protein DND62_31665 [Pseudomonas syringae pv. pisi]